MSESNYSGYFGSSNAVEITNNTWAGNIYYLTGIILPPGRSFNIAVPSDENDNDLTHFNFVVA